MEKKSMTLGVVGIVMATLIFSTMEVLLKHPTVAGVFHPMQITVERFLVGALCLVPVALYLLRKKGQQLEKSDFGYFAFIGMLCVPCSMVLYQLAISLGEASTVAILFSSNPIFVTILAFLILKEPIFWNNITALVLSIVGIVAIVNPFETTVNGSSVLCTIGAAVLFGTYSVFGRRMTKKYGSLIVTSFSFLFGSLELLVLLLLGHVPVVASFYESIGLSIFTKVPFFEGFSAETIPFFLTIALVNTGAGYVFHMLAMEHTNAQIAALIFFLKPIIAPIFAMIFLQEVITGSTIVGIGFFLAGSLCGIIPPLLRSRAQKRAEAATTPPPESKK